MKSIRFFSFALIPALILTVLLTACFGVKGGQGSGKKLYETFFVGEQGVQYFIKPLTFSNDNGDKLKLDMTFKYKNEVKDSVTTNVSFLKSSMIKQADSLVVKSGITMIVMKNMKYLFVERNGKKYISRYSTKASLADVKKLFESADWTITFYNKEGNSAYSTPSSTKKNLEKINFQVFTLF